MNLRPVLVLWETSRIWGLLAWRAIRSLGLDCRLVKSKDITHAGILGKRAPILLVPGGNARHKAEVLGVAGCNVIKKWLAEGGSYIGICGGAGFALENAKTWEGIGICPWKRAAFSNRSDHMLSGHVNALVEGKKLLLPVWWPGRFAPEPEGGVEILATYGDPGPDLLLGDTPMAGISFQTGEACEYGFSLNYPYGLPLIVGGHYGKGRYILSYSHLETPLSREANALLCRYLSEKFGIGTLRGTVGDWNTFKNEAEIDAALPEEFEKGDFEAVIRSAYCQCRKLVGLGMELGLFFPRETWLSGWRMGSPGMACNNLLAMLYELSTLIGSLAPPAFWKVKEDIFKRIFHEFIKRAENWLLNAGKTGRDKTDRNSARELEAVFGHPMLGGGLAEDILAILEELIYLAQKNGETG